MSRKTIAILSLLVLMLAGNAASQNSRRYRTTEGDLPDAEFQMALIKYRTSALGYKFRVHYVVYAMAH